MQGDHGAIGWGTRVGELTAFEYRILSLRTTGLSRLQIAKELGRSPQTISNALTIAKEKLGAQTLMEAARLIGTVKPTR